MFNECTICLMGSKDVVLLIKQGFYQGGVRAKNIDL